jgi:hypothetical protein
VQALNESAPPASAAKPTMRMFILDPRSLEESLLCRYGGQIRTGPLPLCERRSACIRERGVPAPFCQDRTAKRKPACSLDSAQGRRLKRGRYRARPSRGAALPACGSGEGASNQTSLGDCGPVHLACTGRFPCGPVRMDLLAGPAAFQPVPTPWGWHGVSTRGTGTVLIRPVPGQGKEHIANREQIMYIVSIAIASVKGDARVSPRAKGSVVGLSNPGHKEHEHERSASSRRRNVHGQIESP